MQFINKTNHLNKNEKVRENSPEYLVLHATHSYPEWEDLLKHHLNRGFAGIGYHIFVSKSGKTYKNREFNWHGAHCIGLNESSIGLCFYLGEHLSEQVKNSVKEAIGKIKNQFPEIKIISHTQGQLMYLNQLLKQEGFEEQFPEDNEVVLKEKFEKVKNLANKILEKQKILELLKERLNALRNCPEEGFFELIKRH